MSGFEFVDRGDGIPANYRGFLAQSEDGLIRVKTTGNDENGLPTYHSEAGVKYVQARDWPHGLVRAPEGE